MRERLTRLGLWMVACAWLTGCSVTLQHDLVESDANEIYVLLQRHGIDSTKERNEDGNEPVYAVVVSKRDVARAAQLLKDHSLPRPRADGLSIFKKSKGMIPTQTEERAMFLEALGGEVANSLNRVPGVLEASVIVVLPEASELLKPEDRPHPTASVLVKYRPDKDGRPPLTDEQVRFFVASAVPELKREGVTVLLTPATFSDDVQGPDALQNVLGLSMTDSSATQFKVMVAVAGVLILLMAGFTTWNFLRSNGARPPRRGRATGPSDD